MTDLKLNILILEDSIQDKILITERLADAGLEFDVTHAVNQQTFTEALNGSQFDLIISDFKLPGYDAFAALELCRKTCPNVPFICISGSIGEETAVELLKKGAVDYVLKDRPERLPFAINRALDDIKEKQIRLKAEYELRESEKRFRQVAESANEWIWEVDTEGLYTYSSPVIETLLGYVPEEVVGKLHFYDLYHSEEKEKLKTAAFEVFRKREIFNNFENTNQKKNGDFIVLSTSGSPVFDDSGNFIGYRGVDEDITEKKAVEAEQMRLLKQVERDRLALLSTLEDHRRTEIQLRKLSQAVEQSPASTIITNPEGEIEYVNPKFNDITGYSLEEIIAKKPSILKSGYQSVDFYKELWDTISSGNEWRGELLNKKKNGELYWETARISPIKNEKGEILNYIAVKEDITELKQAEKNFRLSLDQSPIGIRIESQSGKTVYANKAFLDIYDMRSLSEFVNTPSILRYSSDSYKDHLERKRIRKEGREITDYDIDIKRKNGEVRHVKVWRKEVIWNRQKHFQVINLDVTDQKHTELALQRSEERFRIVQELSPDGFTIMQPLRNSIGEVVDFEWVYENQAIARINKTIPEEIKGKRLLEIFPSHKETTLFEKYVHVASTGEHQIIEEIYVGEILSVPTWLRLVIVPLGEDIAILSQDISERIKSEMKRKQREETIHKLSQAVEQSTVSVAITNTTGEIEYINTRFSELTGYSFEEVKDKKLRIFNPGKITDRELQILQKALSEGKEWRGEYQNRKKNNQLYWEQVVISPIKNNLGEIINLIVNCEDITERKNIELKLNNTLNQLKKFGSHLQKVREEEKILLAREIHDDLGQLLVAMKIDIGMTKSALKNVLNKKLKDEISLKLANHSDMIAKAITSTRRIMNGLRPVKLEMLGFAGAALEYISEFISRYDIHFDTKIDMGIEKLDEERSLALYRILQESLNNVIKHANASKVIIVYQRNHKELLLEISDNGVGFNIEKDGRSDSYGLLGIKERVILLNGTFSIVSSPGNGTKVSVRFPLD